MARDTRLTLVVAGLMLLILIAIVARLFVEQGTPCGGYLQKGERLRRAPFFPFRIPVRAISFFVCCEGATALSLQSDIRPQQCGTFTPSPPSNRLATDSFSKQEGPHGEALEAINSRPA